MDSYFEWQQALIYWFKTLFTPKPKPPSESGFTDYDSYWRYNMEVLKATILYIRIKEEQDK